MICVSETIFYVFVKLLSKPLYCDYVVVSLSCCVHYADYVLYARLNKQLVLGIAVTRYSHEREGRTKLDMVAVGCMF